MPSQKQLVSFIFPEQKQIVIKKIKEIMRLILKKFTLSKEKHVHEGMLLKTEIEKMMVAVGGFNESAYFEEDEVYEAEKQKAGRDLIIDQL